MVDVWLQWSGYAGQRCRTVIGNRYDCDGGQCRQCRQSGAYWIHSKRCSAVGRSPFWASGQQSIVAMVPILKFWVQQCEVVCSPNLASEGYQFKWVRFSPVLSWIFKVRPSGRVGRRRGLSEETPILILNSRIFCPLKRYSISLIIFWIVEKESDLS